jgi:outer membrane protein insertion porin family
MKTKWLAAALAASIFTSSPLSLAFDAFEVNDVRVEGLQRIAEGTVFNYLPIRMGETLTESRTDEVIRALFDTGFFKDIKLSQDGNVLVIKVLERPTIGKIEVSGNHDVPSDKLMSTLKDAGLAEGYVFDRSTLEMVRNELERLYFSHGKYAVKVDTIIDDQENNRVNISIKVEEGYAARIKAIEITGNQEFSDSQLAKRFTLNSTNSISWISRSDQYDKQKLNADLESLRAFYLDRGYLNFKVLSTQVSITPDKRDIFINVNIDEGKPFTLTGYQLAGEFVLPEDELLSLVDLNNNETFSRAKVASVVKNITEKLGEHGYAFAKVNPVPELNEDNNTVKISFFIEAGNLVNVRRVLFEGNTKTRDEVLRRDIIQMESAPINTKMVEDSRTRLNRTGYFSEVKVETRPVSNATDLVDVIFFVEEASAGQLGGGVGYSDVDGLIFNANVSNRNFMGTGNSLDFSFNRSKAYTTYNMNYVNPYHTIDGVSRGFSVYYSETDLSESTSISDYNTDAYGANVHYSMPISPTSRISYGYGFQSTQLETSEVDPVTGGGPPLEIQAFTNMYGKRSDEISIALGWSQNSFDRYMFPQNGVSNSLSLSATVPGSDLQYYRLTYSFQLYKHLHKGFIFSFNTALGYGNGYGDTKELPFYRNFFAGGPRSVRGFEESSLGPRDSSNHPFGGNAMVSASTGLILPNPFEIDSKAVRVTLFFDIGQVYDFENQWRYDSPLTKRHIDDNLRSSVGISLTWMTPMAPLVFSLAEPVSYNKDFDKIKKFSFTFGTVF